MPDQPPKPPPIPPELAARLGQAPAWIEALIDGLRAAGPEAFADHAAWLSLLEPPPARLDRAALLGWAQARIATPRPKPPHPAVRLAALRRDMARLGLDLLLVPHEDEYLNEYPPERGDRLAWLTDFTGSAGLCAVPLDDRQPAMLFVDGRYTLQAAEECDTRLYAFRHLHDQPLHPWLESIGRPGLVIGFDPAIHAESWRQSLARLAQDRGWTLKPVTPHPVDRVRQDLPPVPLSAAIAQPLDLTGRGEAEKRAEIAAGLRQAGIQALLIARPENLCWLLNARGADVPATPLILSFGLLQDDATLDWIVEPSRLTPALRRTLPQEAVRIHAPDRLEALLAQLGKAGGRVQIDPAATPARLAQSLRTAGAKLVEAPDPITAAKAIKTPAEQAGARRAHRRDGIAMIRCLAWLDRSIAAGATLSECDVAAEVTRQRARMPLFKGESFSPIAAAGPNGAVVHYRPKPGADRRLEPGSLFLLDSGGQYQDGTTDVTRVIPIGRPSRTMQLDYTRVLQAHLRLGCQRFPAGTTGAQLDGIARAPLWAAGLDYDHGTGHGVGSYLSVHEGPPATRRHAAGLQAGMLISNEPGLYRTGQWGIRIETLVLTQPVTAGSRMLQFETLTLVPYDRRLILTALLDPAERAWIDRRHRLILGRLGPRLDPQDRDWLTAMTRPLA